MPRTATHLAAAVGALFVGPMMVVFPLLIRDHYAAKGMDEEGLYKHIKGILEERHVRWGRAV